MLWTPRTGPIDPGIGTGRRSTAVKVNDRGMVIGNVLNFPVLFHGFVWTCETGLIEIGADLPLVQTSADDVNNRGQVVGSFGGRACVWTRAHGIADLDTRIAGTPEGLVLEGARAFSGNGGGNKVRGTVTDSARRSTTVQRKLAVCGASACAAGEGGFLPPASAPAPAGATVGRTSPPRV